MSELIKREDAIKATWHDPSYIDPYNILTEVRDRIEALPTVDAVPVVRCQERMEKQRLDVIADLYKYTANLILTYDEDETDGERRTESAEDGNAVR